MTDEQRLAEIRARADAATPGPWETDRKAAAAVSAHAAHYVLAEGGVRAVAGLYHAALPNAANAAFVAHSRDDVPWLLDLVQQQSGVIADLAEESDAARLALRYREALERIASEPQRLSTVMSVAREALEGNP